MVALEDHRVAEYNVEAFDRDRLRTYRWFVRSMFLFAAHALTILIILAIVFL